MDLQKLMLKEKQKLNACRKIFVLFLLTLTILIISPKPVAAHTPHDDIFDIEISPEYNQDGTIFTISREILLKSTDKGLTWQRLVNGLDNKGRLSSLDISPQNKQILFLSSLRDGVYKSQDAGISWSKGNKGLSTLEINNVRVSPSSGNIVFATGLQYGLYRTLNGGETWSSIADPKMNVTAIAFPPKQTTSVMIGDNQGHLYSSDNNGETWHKSSSIRDSGAIRAVATSPKFESDKTFFIGTEKSGIFKTIDGGKTFLKINNGISDLSITSINVSPKDGGDLRIWSSTWDEGVFLSENGGRTWKKQSEGLTKSSQGDDENFKRPHFSRLRTPDSSSSDRIMFVAGFDGLFKSENGGQSWREFETLSSSIVVGLSISPNYQNDSTIATTTYINGPHLSENGGSTWKAIHNGLEEDFRAKNDYISRLFSIIFSPTYQIDNTIFTTSRNKFLRSKDKGNHWEKIPLFRRKIWNLGENISKKNSIRRICIISVSLNYSSDKTIYLGTQHGDIFRSTDRGTNFSVIGHVPHRILSLVIVPDHSSRPVIYAGTKDGIYKTSDGGYHWKSSGDNIKNVVNLAISPSYKSDKTVFSGTQDGLFVTKDGGNSWVKINNTPYGDNASIEAVVVSPDYQNDRTLLISVQGKGLFKSINNGNTFTKVGESLINSNQLFNNFTVPTAVPIQFSPSYRLDRTIYGFSNTELFKSTDQGETWKNITPPKAVYKIYKQKKTAVDSPSPFLSFPFRNFFSALTASLFSFFQFKLLS
jgi:photosystem II stability/assembly factor-like uncharacterized protein